MPADWTIDIRPRTVGEILDDAWRLYWRDVPLLLSLSGLFTVPFALGLFLLLTRAGGSWERFLLPGVTALLLPLTGLGSGACQEAFRRMAEGHRPALGECLAAACRRGFAHASARACLAGLVCLGGLCLIIPGLGIGIAGTSVHPMLASGQATWMEALGSSVRETQRNWVKAMLITMSRFVLLGVAVVNMHLLIGAGLWIVENLAGFDTALPGVLFSFTNATYMTALILFTWILLCPYAEAVHYFLHSEARTRFEGLDLWYRVRRLFPLGEKAGAVLVFFALGLMTPSPASAAEKLTAVRSALQEVKTIRREVEKANPFPGGRKWEGRLQDLIGQLEDGDRQDRFRWLRQAVEGFGRRNRNDAIRVLTQVEDQLTLLEENLTLQAGTHDRRPSLSKANIKGVLPKESANVQPEDPPTPEEPRRRRLEKKRRGDTEGGAQEGPGLVVPQAAAGFGDLGWIVLIGLLVAVVVVGLVLAWRNRPLRRSPVKKQTVPTSPPGLDHLLTQPEQFAAALLWRRAEELAQTGNFLEGMRTLYLAVLALLHRNSFIRFERTRTNGEYLDQLRSRPLVHEPFRGLTDLFEWTWYGKKACARTDFDACLSLAKNIEDKISG